MKILRGIIIFLGSVLILWLVIAAFVSGKCQYEKSISINAPAEKVWQYTNTLKTMDTWNPKNDADPGMKKDWSGTTGQPGEKMCWTSSKNTAVKGCQEIIKLDPAEKRIDTSITYAPPYESSANAYVKVVPEGSGSKVTWGFTSEIPYPFTLMKVFMDMESSVGKDYQKGLSRLKEMAERP
jgi:uncharacterized protein YndB with AHSA1/START domain